MTCKYLLSTVRFVWIIILLLFFFFLSFKFHRFFCILILEILVFWFFGGGGLLLLPFLLIHPFIIHFFLGCYSVFNCSTLYFISDNISSMLVDQSGLKYGVSNFNRSVYFLSSIFSSFFGSGYWSKIVSFLNMGSSLPSLLSGSWNPSIFSSTSSNGSLLNYILVDAAADTAPTPAHAENFCINFFWGIANITNNINK